MKHRMALLLAALCLVIGGTWIYFHYFFDLLGDCSKQIVMIKPSPTNKYSAQEQIVSCGATTSDSTQFSIRKANAEDEVTVLSLKGDFRDSCNIAWNNEFSLRVDCSENIETVYTYKKEFEEVRIDFFENEIPYTE